MLNFNRKNISKNLSSIKSLIEEIITNSENDFISIGSYLRTFLNESKAITNASITSVKVLSEDLFSKGIIELEELLEQLNSYLNRFSNEIKIDKEDLTIVLENCVQINDEVSQFRNIVKQLKILGVSTKIESERLGSRDLGFMALANGVETLSEVIDKKSTEIKKQSAFLITEINSIIRNLTKIEHVQSEQSELILNTTSSAIEIFRSKNSKCCHILNGISESSEDVSINISEVVTSIQMHDITRQKFEHVNSAVELIGEKTNANLHIEENELIENLYQTKDTCYLQAAQVQDANSEFCKSVLAIIDSLRIVEESVTRMFEFSNELFITNIQSSGGSFLEMEEKLSFILDELIKNIKLSTELSRSIIGIINIVERLTKVISEIEELGAEIEIIALNSRIRSIRTGNEGLALSVISEAIQNLSIRTKELSSKINLFLRKINVAAIKLKNSSSEEIRKINSDELTSFDIEIKNLLDKLQISEKDEASSLETMKIKVANLKNSITELLSNLSIQEKVNHISNKCIDLFGEIIKEIELLPEIESVNKINIASHLNLYTMNREREIHESLLSESKYSPIKTNNRNKSAKNDFGDNVELF